jgi:hypothetical protein
LNVIAVSSLRFNNEPCRQIVPLGNKKLGSTRKPGEKASDGQNLITGRQAHQAPAV